jgi:trimeric autotransporter adhesin
MSFGANTTFGFGSAGGGGGIVVAGARNGVSVDSGNNIVLGQNVGAAGNPAVLLSPREVPMAGNSILWSGVGASAAGNLPAFIFKSDATRTGTTPFMFFEDSTGAEMARINFIADFATDDGSVYIGGLSGALDTGATQLDNVAVGWKTLQVNTGNFHAVVGYEALFSNTSGIQNSVVGNSAMFSNTTGSNNTAVGFFALEAITTGSQNTSVGAFAGSGIHTSGADNTSIGYNTGVYGGSATQGNVAFGSQALTTTTHAVGNTNIAIGFKCGFGATTTVGSNNILIGPNIVIGNNFSNTTVIGQGITVSISNVVVLGRADQNIILGSTAAPTDTGQKLQVLGNALISGSIETADPGSGPGTWELGVVVSAAVTLNATQYVAISIGGTLIKLLTGN